MDKYDMLKEKIDSYFEMPDFISNEYEISAYKLYNMVKNRFSLLSDNSLLDKIKNEINKEYKPSIFNLFKDKNELHSQCSNIYYLANLKSSAIAIDFRLLNYKDICKKWRTISVLKDRDSNELYFGKYSETGEYAKNLVLKYYDEFMEIFNLCEYFTSLVDGAIREGESEKNPNFKKQIFSDGFLNIELSYNEYGNVSTYISINSKSDPENVSARTYLNRQSLNEYLNNNKDILLRKIPIDIDDLNKVCRQIYDEDTKNITKSKILSLKDK